MFNCNSIMIRERIQLTAHVVSYCISHKNILLIISKWRPYDMQYIVWRMLPYAVWNVSSAHTVFKLKYVQYILCMTDDLIMLFRYYTTNIKCCLIVIQLWEGREFNRYSFDHNEWRPCDAQYISVWNIILRAKRYH